MVTNDISCRACRLIFSLLLLSAMPVLISNAYGSDRIAVVVNDDAIMLSEIDARVQNLQTNNQPASDPSRQTMLRQAIDELVVEHLQLQQARKMGIPDENPRQAIETLYKQKTQDAVSISEQEVNDLIASQSDALTRGARFNLQHILIAIPTNASLKQINNARERAIRIHKRLKNGEDFTSIARTESDSYAASSGGNLGWQDAEKLPDSFNRALALMNTGDISGIIRDTSGLQILKLLGREGGKSKLGTSTRTRHILISTEKLPDEAAHERIDLIYQQLLKGASFAQLAVQYSDDPGSGAKGGDLGWIIPGQTVEPFEQTMDQTAINAISPPFKTQFGWHILQVLERKQTDMTEEARRNKARAYLVERKADEYYQAWLQKLRSDAYIEYRIPLNNLELQLK